MRSLRVLNILIVLVIAHSWVRLPSCTRGSRWPGTLPPGTLPPVHHGPLKAHTINDGNETEYRRFVAPAVHSRDTLFGAPMLPRDSIDRAVHSKLDVDDTNHMQALAGLEKNTPTELRMGTTTNEGGEEVTNVVETVDTFRFTISAADMERLSQAEAQDGHMQAATINADGTDGSQDAGQKLLAADHGPTPRPRRVARPCHVRGTDDELRPTSRTRVQWRPAHNRRVGRPCGCRCSVSNAL